MSEEIKKISIKEFREKGYLQELNRQFLHPLGLALEVLSYADGNEELGGIWDYREDKEGIYYDIANSEEDRKAIFRMKMEHIAEELENRSKDREDAIGFIIEPIP